MLIVSSLQKFLLQVIEEFDEKVRQIVFFFYDSLASLAPVNNRNEACCFNNFEILTNQSIFSFFVCVLSRI